MTATIADNEIDRYVAEVAGHLGGLPEGERAELLDDLRQHLIEVAAEDDTSLEVRLGPPERYAAELLATAGLASADTEREPRGLLHDIAARGRRARESRTWRETAAFLPELRPGWWVARGAMAAFVLSAFMVDSWDRTWPIPGNAGWFLVLLAVLVPTSVALGQRALRRAGGGGGIRLVNVAVVLAFLAAVAAMDGARHQYYEPAYDNPTGLFQVDGRAITNIFPSGADGALLEGVLLYDQDGRPIEAHRTADAAGLATGFPLDVNGAPITNAYPLEQEPVHEPFYEETPTTLGGRSVGQPTAVVIPRRETTTTTEAPSPADPGGVPPS